MPLQETCFLYDGQILSQKKTDKKFAVMLRPLIKSFLWRAIFQSEKGNHSGKGNWGEGKEEGGLWKRGFL